MIEGWETMSRKEIDSLNLARGTAFDTLKAARDKVAEAQAILDSLCVETIWDDEIYGLCEEAETLSTKIDDLYAEIRKYGGR